MYAGNGVTTEFPLPEGNDGTVVYLVSPQGAAVRMKQGDAYEIQNGTAVFSEPPPAGWTVAFQTGQGPAALAGFGAAPQGLLVIYPDGSFKRLDRDPWELLAEVKVELAGARQMYAETREAEARAVAEIRALEAAAAGNLEGRLLGYGARAEDAINAAVAGAAGELSEKLAGQLREIREEREAAQKQLRETQVYVETLVEEMLKKAAELKTDTDGIANDWREEVEIAQKEARAALLGVREFVEAALKSVGGKIDQAEEQVKSFMQETERARAEFREMLEEAVRRFPAPAGIRGDRIRRTRTESAEEGDAIV
jgi:hypothetical protein